VGSSMPISATGRAHFTGGHDATARRLEQGRQGRLRPARAARLRRAAPPRPSSHGAPQSRPHAPDDHARRYKYAKRGGGGALKVSLSEAGPRVEQRAVWARPPAGRARRRAARAWRERRMVRAVPSGVTSSGAIYFRPQYFETLVLPKDVSQTLAPSNAMPYGSSSVEKVSRIAPSLARIFESVAL
jgi:hypothetical protein